MSSMRDARAQVRWQSQPCAGHVGPASLVHAIDSSTQRPRGNAYGGGSFSARRVAGRREGPETGKIEAVVVGLGRAESGPLQRRNQRLLLPSPAPPSAKVEVDIPTRLVEYAFLQHTL